jgi:hypothetical protein
VMVRVTKIEDESRAVRGGWHAAIVRIQYFGFGSRGEAMG